MVNTSSLVCFKRETTEGSAIITAVNTVTSKFGGYSSEMSEISVPVIKNNLTTYYTQSSRKPNNVFGAQDIPEFNLQFAPASAIPYYQFLGSATASTGTPIHVRETGKKDSYTIRHEEQGGTNQLIQPCGCYNVGITGKAEMNKEEQCVQTWIAMSMEDQDDRPSLTTMPTFPEDIETVYAGIPIVMWDVGGVNSQLSEVYKAEWAQSQNYTIVKTGTGNQIYLHEYNSGSLKLDGILSSNDQWDALKNMSDIEIDIKTYKQNDLTKYKTMKFFGCKLVSLTKVGKIFEGAYVTSMQFSFDYMEVVFMNEFGTNWTNWFIYTS